MMKTAAIIVAAGVGKRMNSTTKKQYMNIGGYPVLYYTLRAFEQSCVEDIILVTGEDEIDFVSTEIVKKFGFSGVRAVIAGGKERYDSVYCGIRYLKDVLKADDTVTVLVHDGVRPLVTVKLIDAVALAAEENGASIAAVSVKDTVKSVDINNVVTGTPDRSELRLIQTPQGFELGLLSGAYEKMYAPGLNRDGAEPSIKITDDAMLVEQFTGHPVYCIEGDYGNIKITTPDDIRLAEFLLGGRA